MTFMIEPGDFKVIGSVDLLAVNSEDSGSEFLNNFLAGGVFNRKNKLLSRVNVVMANQNFGNIGLKVVKGG